MSDDVVVSIVIPNFNNSRFVSHAINSGLRQTLGTSRTEIIVIDDGSTDASLDIIRSFGNRIRWDTGTNRGAPAARNRGLELAQGKYVKFLDADDVLLPDCLELQVAQAEQLAPERKAIVYGDAMRVDESGMPLPGYAHRPRTENEDPIAHILSNSPLISCPLHRRDYLLEIGGFDPVVPKGQEQDLHLRLVLAGVEFIYCPGAVFYYREYKSSQRISSLRFKKNKTNQLANVLEKQIKQIEAATRRPLSPVVRTLMAQRYWRYGRALVREGSGHAASIYFQRARELDAKQCVVGKAPYPQLVTLLGPIVAEQFMAAIRRIAMHPRFYAHQGT